ncbi:MAG: translation initiation factor IF-3, partial [Candidatus Portnoybacteria bacterium]|nr:translation initiation factor IF-3 [Candidatus Portnoybacteria bacterium]
MIFRRGFKSRRLHHYKFEIKPIYKKYYNKNRQQRVRINQWIGISPIRLIDEKGQNLGIIETNKALELAQEKGLDLIEIAPTVRPPVCRIMDYGKYQYQKAKEEKQQKTKQKRIEIQGIRIS